jgi:hypothetical protein
MTRLCPRSTASADTLDELSRRRCWNHLVPAAAPPIPRSLSRFKGQGQNGRAPLWRSVEQTRTQKGKEEDEDVTPLPLLSLLVYKDRQFSLLVCSWI